MLWALSKFHLLYRSREEGFKMGLPFIGVEDMISMRQRPLNKLLDISTFRKPNFIVLLEQRQKDLAVRQLKNKSRALLTFVPVVIDQISKPSA